MEPNRRVRIDMVPLLKMHAHAICVVQGLEPDAWPHQKEFALDMLRWTDNDNTFLDNVFFCLELPFILPIW
jgi:hypothetical protein